MQRHISRQTLHFTNAVTLVGGGTLDRARLDQAMAVAPHLVAADGAADRLDALGLAPEAIIGDMDSLSDPAVWAERTQVVSLAEQDSTDFEKCLYATDAPFYVAAGFTGRRVDHMLAVFHAMLVRAEKHVVLLGEDEAIALLPPNRPVDISLAPGARVSLYPLLPARGVQSRGLRWPIDGLAFQAGQQVGTSNQAVADAVSLTVEGPGVLLMIEPQFLGSLLAGLGIRA